jgi:hypothetical protein
MDTQKYQRRLEVYNSLPADAERLEKTKEIGAWMEAQGDLYDVAHQCFQSCRNVQGDLLENIKALFETITAEKL